MPEWFNNTLGYLGLRKANDALDPVKLKAAVQLASENVEAFNKLREELEGDLVIAAENGPKFEEYETARKLSYYYNYPGYPVAVVKVANIADVQKSVLALSKSEQLGKFKLALCCGGHTKFSVVDNSIVLHLQALNEISMDVDAKTVTCGGGCKIEEVDKFMAASGAKLGFVTGTNGDTGVSGLTLASGFGFLSRMYGFAADNVVEAKVVLANGELITVNDSNEHADLLRAMRGGSGNWGVVVQWTFKTHDVSNCFGGYIVKLLPTQARCSAAMKTWRAKVESQELPDEACALAVFPCGAPVNIFLGVTFEEVKTPKSYTDFDGLKYLKDIPGFTVQNTIKSTDYHSDVQTMLEPFFPRSFVQTMALCLYELTDEAIEYFTMMSRSKYATSGSAIVLFRLGGRLTNEELEKKASVTHRKAKYWVVVDGVYHRYSTQETINNLINWLNEIRQYILNSSGAMLAYPHYDPTHNPKDAANHQTYTGKRIEFLKKMKTHYDPTNLFSLCKNIKPSTGEPESEQSFTLGK